MPNTHIRDPIGGEAWFFVDDLMMGDGEKDARTFYELAIRHQISFKGIFAVLLAVMQVLHDYDLAKELRALCKEGERNIDLMKKFELPAEQLVRIWMQSLEALHWEAEVLPEVRERNERFIAEQYEAMIAMLERHQRRQEAN
jgi:hypothetical protein